MKTPPLLLGAGLLFWGWQAGHLVEGALMAGLLEGAQSVKARWDFTDEDFRRIWTFCALLLFGAALYAFTSTGGPGGVRGFFPKPKLQHTAAGGCGGRGHGGSAGQCPRHGTWTSPTPTSCYACSRRVSTRGRIKVSIGA